MCLATFTGHSACNSTEPSKHSVTGRSAFCLPSSSWCVSYKSSANVFVRPTRRRGLLSFCTVWRISTSWNAFVSCREQSTVHANANSALSTVQNIVILDLAFTPWTDICDLFHDLVDKTSYIKKERKVMCRNARACGFFFGGGWDGWDFLLFCSGFTWTPSSHLPSHHKGTWFN